jgi:trehalose 6-phosphate synthase/phosphatase
MLPQTPLIIFLGIFVPKNYESVEYRYLVFSGGKFVRFEGDGELRRNLSFPVGDATQQVMVDRLDEGPSMLAVSEHGRSSISANSYAASNRTRQFVDSSGRRSVDVIKNSDSVVVVSYYLPVFLKKNEDNEWIAQWNNENILSFESKLTVKWVGTVHHSSVITPEDEEAITAALAPMNCHPIFISRDIHRKFYNVVCKEHLWPVMHHNADVFGPAGLKELGHQTEKNLWLVYSTVNSIFGHKVVEVYQEGAMIWIHGFHLMLLPFNLRRSIQLAKIGIFLHTPFPSSEIWKTLWCRTDLLRGMLSADQIGFHLYEYGRHFLTTCRRVLGTYYEFDAAGALNLHVGGRNVYVTCVHVGVDHRHIAHAIQADEFTSEVAAWKSKFAGKIVIAGMFVV